MSNWAIVAEGIGKQYSRRAFTPGARPNTLVGEIGLAVKSAFQRSKRDPAADLFWALKDVSFEVTTGQRMAIIGVNGSGKSTLLKILSRITAPTEGHARLRGRVASLLEVGTGFHQELTGRENIYLNGAILGLSHADINRVMDSIIDFSGVEAFIDTPIKRYSSGMHVRLAFAVAAHLDPDILIVDEVLAVGDAAFQKKCTTRMNEAAREGRTILFVSHGMASVKSLCDRAMLIDRGRVVRIDNTTDVVDEYMSSIVGESTMWLRPEVRAGERLGNEYAEFISGRVDGNDGDLSGLLPIEAPFRVSMRYRLLQDTTFDIVPNFHVFDESGNRLFITTPADVSRGTAGEHVATCVFPAFCLNVGRYSIRLILSSFQLPQPVHFDNPDHLQIEIHENVQASDPRRHGYVGNWPGVVRPRLDWHQTSGSHVEPSRKKSYAD